MKRILLLFSTLLLLAGCKAQEQVDLSLQSGQSEQEEKTATVFAMDTVMDFTVYGATEELMQSAENRVSQLEALFSVTDVNSEIYALNRTGTSALSDDTATLLQQALSLCSRTDGALDISIYPIVRAWGFTTGTYQIPSTEERSALLENVDYTKVTLQDQTASIPIGMEIDLGSVAKGYTGDVLSALLKSSGVTSALLNLGGNVQALGSKPDGSPWRVAVQNPEGDGYLGVLELTDQAAITSGGYERYFVGEDGQTYWHIIDPATGTSAHSGLISVTIVGNSGLTCDALSTSLFIMGAQKAEEFWRKSDDFEAIWVSEDGSVSITEGLQDCFTLAGDSTNRALTVITR